jgi:hypothetical protein
LRLGGCHLSGPRYDIVLQIKHALVRKPMKAWPNRSLLLAWLRIQTLW